MQFSKAWLVGLAIASFTASPALAKQWEVKMLNRSSAGMMVFEPAFLKILPGDTVKFDAVDKGHNAEAINGLAPEGAPAFKGKMNEEIVVKFTKPGLYGYKCMPHFAMGMVGLIQVGAAANKQEFLKSSGALPPLAQKAMSALISKVK